jgi:hypothetical protein
MQLCFDGTYERSSTKGKKPKNINLKFHKDQTLIYKKIAQRSFVKTFTKWYTNPEEKQKKTFSVLSCL